MSDAADEDRDDLDEPRGDRRALAATLFALTCLSTLYVGAGQVLGRDPLDDFSRARAARGLAAGALVLARDVGSGWPFAAPLMAILLCHELAHWVAMRRHGVPSTLPLFIPFPNVFGTMGAVIAMRDRVRSRDALVDVGASGPLAGLVVSIGVTLWGLARSTIEPVAGRTGVFVEGDSLLYLAMKRAVCGPIPAGQDVWLHPAAFAGWVGLFMTMMNLLPIGQLDGGHVAYAIFGPRYDRWSRRVVYAVALWALALGGWIALSTPRALWVADRFAPAMVWGLWAALTRVVLRMGGDRHPPTEGDALSPGRRAVAWLALALFVALFMPVPLRLQ